MKSGNTLLGQPEHANQIQHPFKGTSSKLFQQKLIRVASAPNLEVRHECSPDSQLQFRDGSDNTVTKNELIDPTKSQSEIPPHSNDEAIAKSAMPSEDHFTRVRQLIIDDLVNRGKIERSYGESLQRAIDHVMSETVEVLSWIPKVTDVDQLNLANKNNTVVIHYGSPLYETMYRTLSEAGTYHYLTNQAIHIRECLTTATNKQRKFLSNTKGILNLNGATVIITICYGVDRHLSGEALQTVIDDYLSKGVTNVCIYLGEYNSVDHPKDQIEKIANEKREAWKQKNLALYELAKKDPRIQIRMRAEWIEKPCYQEARQFFEKVMLSNTVNTVNTNLIYGAIMKDAMRYINGKIKQYSQEDDCDVSENDILEELMLRGKESIDAAKVDPIKDHFFDQMRQWVETAKDPNVIANYGIYTASFLKHSHSLFKRNEPQKKITQPAARQNKLGGKI